MGRKYDETYLCTNVLNYRGTFCSDAFSLLSECLHFDRSICGVRARVEFSTGKSKPKPWQVSPRRGPLPSRRAFDPEDRCYECGQRGHYAYDCEIRLNKRKGMLVRTDDVHDLTLICYICECLILAKNFILINVYICIIF